MIEPEHATRIRNHEQLSWSGLRLDAVPPGSVFCRCALFLIRFSLANRSGADKQLGAFHCAISPEFFLGIDGKCPPFRSDSLDLEPDLQPD